MKEKIKYKITPEIQKRIAEVVNHLPPMGKFIGNKPVYRTVEVAGTEVRPEDLKPGQPVISSATYRVRRLVYEDHTKNLIDLVRNGGEIEIEHYENAVMAQLNLWKDNERREKQLGNRIIKLLLKLPWIKRKAR